MSEKTEEQLKAEAAAAEAKAAAAAEKAAAKAAAKAAKEEAAAAKKLADEAAKAERKAAAEAAKAEKAEAAKAEKARKITEKEAAKAAKEAARMPEQNGVRRPKPTTLCGKVWDLADNLSNQLGQPVPISTLLEHARPAGLNEGNVKTEYARWRKFHGVTGRVAHPSPIKPAEAAPAQAAEEAPSA